MTKFNLNADLDEKIQASLADQGDYLKDMSMVYALQTSPVIAPTQMFYVTIQDKKVLPIFTRETDWEKFTAKMKTEMTWQATEFLPLLNEAMGKEIEVIGFNIDPDNLESFENHAYFGKELLMAFFNHYTNVMNIMFSPENRNADKWDKQYFVPLFMMQDDKKEQVHVFPQLTAADGKDYLPVFDNLDSFANWYLTKDFVESFKKEDGVILLWQLKEFISPKTGRNILGKSAGITINPLDYDINDYAKTITSWEDFPK